MHITKTSLMMATIIALMLTNTEAATSASSSLYSGTVVVEASGNVPGFTETQLPTYLARRMHEETADHWQFSVRKPGAAPAPNRLIWSFKTLRVDWKAGSHRGFPSPAHSVSYLSAEVKLYLKNTYRTRTLAQPTISGEPDDNGLSEMVRNVAHFLFVENKPDMP